MVLTFWKLELWLGVYWALGQLERLCHPTMSASPLRVLLIRKLERPMPALLLRVLLSRQLVRPMLALLLLVLTSRQQVRPMPAPLLRVPLNRQLVRPMPAPRSLVRLLQALCLPQVLMLCYPTSKLVMRLLLGKCLYTRPLQNT